MQHKRRPSRPFRTAIVPTSGAALRLAVLVLLGGIGTAGGEADRVESGQGQAVATGPASAAPADDLAARLDAHLRAVVAEEDFSGSVLVARDGRTLLSKGYGLANREHGVPCTAKTKYRIGSVTKQFTAAAILALADDGELDVRDELELYLPDLPEAWHPITIHDLLSHQSGLPNVTNDPEYMVWARLPSRPLKTIERVFDRPLDFEPGTDYAYSNTGFLTLALVVEEASGSRWETYLRERLLDPLGMEDTGHDRNDAILEHRASGYQEFMGKVFNAPFHDMSVPIGGGDVYSTVEDLLIWDEALHGGEGRLLSEASRTAMVTPNRSSYGYGIVAGELLGRPAVHHGGAIFGFRAQLTRFLDERVTVIVLSNTGWCNPQQIAADLAGLIFDEPPVAAGSIPVKKAPGE